MKHSQNSLHNHEVPGASSSLQICVMDLPGSGGGHHHYCLYGFDTARNISDDEPKLNLTHTNIFFQNGPVSSTDSGAVLGIPRFNNGITIEALLAICEHRLQCFQSGPFACQPNADALKNISDALEALHGRTRDRVSRNVEGKEVK